MRTYLKNLLWLANNKFFIILFERQFSFGVLAHRLSHDDRNEHYFVATSRRVELYKKSSSILNFKEPEKKLEKLDQILVFSLGSFGP